MHHKMRAARISGTQRDPALGWGARATWWARGAPYWGKHSTQLRRADGTCCAPIACMQRALIRRRAAHWLAAGQPAIVRSWARTQLDADLLARYEVGGVASGAHDAIIAGHTRPLANLLTAFVRSGESRYRDVYLDERLRFAPHRADPATRAAFFREVLPSDEDAVIQALPAEGELAADMAELLRELHVPLLEVSPTPPIRVLALGDCLLNEVRVFLGAECRRAGLAVDMRNLYFSAAMDRGLDVSEAARFLEQNPTDVVALSFMT